MDDRNEDKSSKSDLDKSTTSKIAERNSRTVKTWLILLVIIGAGFLLWDWGPCSLMEAGQSKIIESDQWRVRLCQTVSSLLESQCHLDQRMNGSINVYIERNLFEDVPVPYRGEIVSKIRDSWCSENSSVRGYSNVILRDMRTDDVLDSRHCWSRVGYNQMDEQLWCALAIEEKDHNYCRYLYLASNEKDKKLAHHACAKIHGDTKKGYCEFQYLVKKHSTEGTTNSDKTAEE